MKFSDILNEEEINEIPNIDGKIISIIKRDGLKFSGWNKNTKKIIEVKVKKYSKNKKDNTSFGYFQYGDISTKDEKDNVKNGTVYLNPKKQTFKIFFQDINIGAGGRETGVYKYN